MEQRVKMSESLSDVMSNDMKIMNLIKNSALNSRWFKRLCKNINADYVKLLYHIEIRWLSRCRALNILAELC